MAAGVPIVAQNEWGWKEMIVDGETGFLTNSDEETVFRLAQLAYDEDLRRKIAADASDYLAELADPQRIAAQWTELFTSLGA
jgi:glycosyltransferase involved in cell wall biosynthesis